MSEISIPMPGSVCDIFYFKNMVKIKKLEFYKGEYNGVDQRLWVAISDNNNVFKTSDLEYYNNVPDIKNTKWEYISNESYSRIVDEMCLFQKIDFENKKIEKSNGLQL